MSLSTLLSGGGLTVMTHGFNSDVDGWIIPMAERFTGRSDFPGSNLSCYIIEIGFSNNAYTTTVTRPDNPPGSNPQPDQNDSGEIVVKLDWSSISTDSETNSTDVAIPAAAALLSSGLIPENNGRPLAELPIHLLGHSRGASIASEIAWLLGQSGVWVDHLTLWDPVDSTFNDATIGVWENVLFADNYYQQLGDFLIPQGRFVNFCYNRRLINLPGGYNYFSGGNHSDVHAWYHATVELGSLAFDGNISISSSTRGSWFTTEESAGAATGFHFSRIADGNRLSTDTPGGTGTAMIVEGYNQMWDLGAGVSPNRNGLSSPAPWTPVDPWPNVMVARRTTSGPLTGGDSIPLEIIYQSEVTGVGDPTLSILLDPDPNPWNGNEISLSSEVVSGSGFSDVLTATPAPVLPPETDGTFHLLASISEDGRTRHFHLREPITVSAAVPSPSIVPGSLRFESGLATFTISGTVGQEVTVQAAGTLDDWSNIATVILASESQDFSDPNSDDFERRFYRLVYTSP